ncbi:hypothetical protein P12x_005575 [Tundrisphaera lichenicola]|uniref:hypothetical protein n=1 Tax=Tundrisphaera lichenicola TaxID=2029860 RepID=UPI003EBBC355
MIANQNTTTLPTPTRRRSGHAVPVLIQIPRIAETRSSRRPARRRRLRREVRFAGFVILALLPISLVFASFGFDRLPHLAASSLKISAEPESLTIPEAPSVSLSLEPVSSNPRELESRVFLPGILLPAESIEEDGDGGH